MTAVKVRRHPLAFGITKWGILPGTRDMWIMWDGPGSRLRMYATDPEQPGAQGIVIEHPLARDVYDTVAAADKAVQALAAEHGRLEAEDDD
jgi:hypothetical protein